jgi:aconitate hydratase
MDEGPLWEVAERYRQEERSVVIVAGERYGAGSSRDWAAKGLALLGVRAVIARSFERIHRTNLIGMGILPIVIENTIPSLSALDLIEVDARHIEARCGIRLVLLSASGAAETLTARAAVETEQEVETLVAGGMIPLILDRHLAELVVPKTPDFVRPIPGGAFTKEGSK